MQYVPDEISHEVRFALAVEPDNADLTAYAAHCTDLRQRNLPTLPSSIGQERLINPFLRSRSSAVSKAVRQHDARAVDDITTFAALRTWKNEF